MPRPVLCRRTALLLLAVAIPALGMSGPASAAQAARVPLPTPNPTSLAGTTKPLNPTQQLALRVYLSGRPGRAPAALDVADPHSPDYAHYLTPAQFQQRFGATAAQTAAVRDWLTGEGMTVTATNPHFLTVAATVAQTDAAFDTQVDEFDNTVDGFTSAAAGVVGGFTVPAALAPDIASVTGIESTQLPQPGNTGPGGGKPTAPAGTRQHKPGPTTQAALTAQPVPAQPVPAEPASAQPADVPCSQYWAQHTAPIPPAFGQTSAPTNLCGYTPDQIRAAYGISGSPYTGKGATVAVVLDGSVPTELADANQFFADHGDAGFAPGQFTEDIDPGTVQTCTGDDPPGDPLEESIDVQAVHIAAPDAHVRYVGTNCSYDTGTELGNWLDGLTKIVDGHLADVVSGSWGYPEPYLSRADAAAWDPVLQQGALEGIGFDFSSGDGGDELTTNDPRHAQFPATDPWATAVGGTSLAIGANGQVVADYPWGDNLTQLDAAGTAFDPAPPGAFYGGSGGGISNFYPQPAFQHGVVPGAVATDNGKVRPARTMPDIAADAGLTWLIGYTGAITDGQFDEASEGGGTSGASPLTAGLEADAKQATGHALGFADPALYQLCGTNALRDIVPVDPAHPPMFYGSAFGITNNDTTLFTLGEDSTTLNATRGYDDVTGLGAPTPAFVTSFRQS